jgi:hypothetical protein
VSGSGFFSSLRYEMRTLTPNSNRCDEQNLPDGGRCSIFEGGHIHMYNGFSSFASSFVSIFVRRCHLFVPSLVCLLLSSFRFSSFLIL